MHKGNNVQQRMIVRNVLKAAGVLGIILFLLGSTRSYIVLIGSAVALFLGLTDFGRQCPLILSLRHFLYRVKSRKQSQIL
jgi:hypothetical protein